MADVAERVGTVRDPGTPGRAGLREAGGQGGQQRAFRATGEGHNTAHQDVAWSAPPVGALWHGRLLARVIGLLHRSLEDRPSYTWFAPGTRVKIRATGRVTRPDVAVVCGPVETDPDDPDALVNPTLLVDVARAGCGEDTTWEHCQRIASLRGYLRVACRSPRLELYARAGGPGVWIYTPALAGERVMLPVVEASLAVDDVYEDLTPLGT